MIVRTWDQLKIANTWISLIGQYDFWPFFQPGAPFGKVLYETEDGIAKAGMDYVEAGLPEGRYWWNSWGEFFPVCIIRIPVEDIFVILQDLNGGTVREFISMILDCQGAWFTQDI